MMDDVFFPQTLALCSFGPIDSSRGREDELVDVVSSKKFHKIHESTNVIAVVLERLLDGFADRFESGKVDHARDLGLDSDRLS